MSFRRIKPSARAQKPPSRSTRCRAISERLQPDGKLGSGRTGSELDDGARAKHYGIFDGFGLTVIEDVAATGLMTYSSVGATVKPLWISAT